MEFKVLLYVIIGIIYVISRVIKKADRSESQLPEGPRHFPSGSDPSNPVAPNTSKPVTFEELLREISEAKKQQSEQRKPVETRRQPAYVNYDDDLKEEEQELEDKNYDYRKRDKIYDIYEEAKKEAFVKPSLEETMKIEDTKVQFGKFREFEVDYKQSVLDQYIKDLKDPEGFKRAVVLSEILNRKF